nr:hypothetical protein [Aeromonas media]
MLLRLNWPFLCQGVLFNPPSFTNAIAKTRRQDVQTAELSLALKDGCPKQGRFCYLAGYVGKGNVPLHVFLRRTNQMVIKARSRREKVGGGLGLVMGLIAFNLIAPLLLESKEISDMNRMIGAMVSAMICSELGARIGKWLDTREQAKSTK